MESVMRWPRGSPRLASIPLRTTNGLRTRVLESAGTSTCQPARFLPLNSFCDRCDARRDVKPNSVATQTVRSRNDFMRLPAGQIEARPQAAATPQQDAMLASPPSWFCSSPGGRLLVAEPGLSLG